MKLLRLMDGVKLGYMEWGASNAKKVLAMHGWLDNANSFSYLGPYLADRGFHVVAFDHFGHGHSSHVGSGGQYTPQKYVAVARDALDILGWDKSHIIGHSMGANISVMYAGTYAEKIDKLVLIEGFGPIVEPAESSAFCLRKAIDAERSKSGKRSAPKLYKSIAVATDARVKVVSSYPGTQYLSREAALALISRGTRLYREDGEPIGEEDHGEHLDDESLGPVRFRHDPKLTLPSYYYPTKDQAYPFFQAIQADTLAIVAEFGWPLGQMQGELERRQKILSDKGLLQVVPMSGSHHLHLDPENAPQCADVIHNFLSTVRRTRQEM